MSEAKTHRLMPDTTFAGRFRVSASIGEGAMGTVYLAQTLDGGEARALKVLKPSIANEQLKGTERFAREAKVGDRIDSEHIIRVFDTGFDEATGLHWLAMEYLDGLPLTAFLEQHQPSDAVRRHLLDQLFSAIAAAHRAGVIHRDLKPDNLFVVDLEREPELKVLDFGVAKTLHASMVASRTEGGLGTPLWTAPEQGKGGEHIRPSVDVWALGLLTFYVLTDKLFWFHANDERSSMLDIATEMLRDDIPLASERARQLEVEGRLPDHLDDWLARCVHRDPEARFADAGRAQAALGEVFAGRPPPPSDRPPPTATSSPEADAPRDDGPLESPPPSESRPPAKNRAKDTLPPTRRHGAEGKPPLGLVITIVVVLIAAVAAVAWWVL